MLRVSSGDDRSSAHRLLSTDESVTRVHSATLCGCSNGASLAPQERVPHEEGEGQSQAGTRRQVETPRLLQTTRRFANMRVGEHVRASQYG